MMYVLFNFLMIAFLSLIILFLIILMNLLLGTIKPKSKNKMSPFECGFNPMINSNSTPFSLPFYLMMLMFMIFDVEIVLMIPIIYYSKFMNMSIVTFSMLLFLMIMLLSLIYEWYNQYFKWVF